MMIKEEDKHQENDLYVPLPDYCKVIQYIISEIINYRYKSTSSIGGKKNQNPKTK